MVTATRPSIATADRTGAEAGSAHPVAVRIRGLTKHFGSGEQRVQTLQGIADRGRDVTE